MPLFFAIATVVRRGLHCRPCPAPGHPRHLGLGLPAPTRRRAIPGHSPPSLDAGPCPSRWHGDDRPRRRWRPDRGRGRPVRGDRGPRMARRRAPGRHPDHHRRRPAAHSDGGGGGRSARGSPSTGRGGPAHSSPSPGQPCWQPHSPWPLTGACRRIRAQPVTCSDEPPGSTWPTTCGAIVAVLALGLVVSCALLGTWMVLWAQYSLRRTAVSAFQFADQITAGHRVHPPNIATALTWALLLATATAVAAWWMAYQCDLLAASAAMNDARTAVEQVTITAAAWCALLVGATICLSAWASREARHRLRVRALGHLNR